MSRSELMWAEKYRPKVLDEVINHEEVIARLKEFLKKPETMPHLLFCGPPGNGKTTVALCIARHLFGGRWKELTLELNASDERGIDMVRERIKTYARAGALGKVPFRLIILDECDHMTSDAQTALRRIMELSSRTCRFILICNYSSRVIEPIQSRCAIFRFPSLKKEDVILCLQSIAKNEGVKLTQDGTEALWKIYKGDLRRGINAFQAASILTKKVGEKEIYAIAAKAGLEEIKAMLNFAFLGNFLEARKMLYEFLIERGISGTDLLNQIHQVIYELDLSEEEKAEIVRLIGEYDFRLFEGASEDIQLSSFLAQLALIKRK